MAERHKQLAHLDYLGDATRFSEQIHALLPKCVLLENFLLAEVRLLTHCMDIYRADPGVEIIREGEGGDFLLMIIEGRVEVMRRDRWNTQQPIATAEAGEILGEMSMIDGEPRFATCVAAAPTTMAVLNRDNLARIIVEQPMLGAKIMRELGLMLSRRLRLTTVRLVELLDEHGSRASDLPLAYRAGSKDGFPL